MFAEGARRESARMPVGQIHQPQLVQRGERQLLAVRRWPRVTNLLDDEHRVIDWIVELYQGSEVDLDIRREWDRRRVSARNIELPQLAAVGDDDCFRVGRPGVARKQIAREA